MTPGIAPELVLAFSQTNQALEDFFRLGMHELSALIEGNNNLRLEQATRDKALIKAEKELKFIERHNIRPLFITENEYPTLLREIYNPPVMLFTLGEAELNAEQTMAVVGTRKCTSYGINFVSSMITGLAEYFPKLLVVSGLAFGIDAAAHKASLDNKLPTAAVLAHGLDMIYPAAHRSLARMILDNGGILVSEYTSKTTPYRRNFLERNRVIAGLSELTVIAESDIRGGAMNTAHQAFVNNREVMALPGRINDKLSSGCNHLIRKEKAHLITNATDIMELMNWRPLNIMQAPKQRNLFPELEGVPAEIYGHLNMSKRPMMIDELLKLTGLPIKTLLSTLTEMEFDGIVSKLPGSRYELSL